MTPESIIKEDENMRGTVTSSLNNSKADETDVISSVSIGTPGSAESWDDQQAEPSDLRKTGQAVVTNIIIKALQSLHRDSQTTRSESGKQELDGAGLGEQESVRSLVGSSKYEPRSNCSKDSETNSIRDVAADAVNRAIS